MAKTWKRWYRVKVFRGPSEKTTFWICVIFDFCPKVEKYSGKGKSGKHFSEKPENRKKCCHEWEYIFSILGSRTFSTFGLCYFEFPIVRRTIENDYFWKSIFSSFRAIGKSNLSGSAHFRCRAIDLPFWKYFSTGTPFAKLFPIFSLSDHFPTALLYTVL